MDHKMWLWACTRLQGSPRHTSGMRCTEDTGQDSSTDNCRVALYQHSESKCRECKDISTQPTWYHSFCSFYFCVRIHPHSMHWGSGIASKDRT